MVRTAYIEDECSRLVLVSDRAHGVSSQADGQLEVQRNKKLWKTEKPPRQTENMFNVPCVLSPGHAPSTSLEQFGLEPRLQPDPERQLGGEAHPVDDAGLCQCHLRALPEGGDRAAAQTRRHAHRPASWVLALGKDIKKCLSLNNVWPHYYVSCVGLTKLPQSLFASRKTLAGEGTQRTFSSAFSRPPAESPPAQPQHPRVELQLQSQCSPQPRSLGSAARHTEGVVSFLKSFLSFWNFGGLCLSSGTWKCNHMCASRQWHALRARLRPGPVEDHASLRGGRRPRAFKASHHKPEGVNETFTHFPC